MQKINQQYLSPIKCHLIELTVKHAWMIQQLRTLKEPSGFRTSLIEEIERVSRQILFFSKEVRRENRRAELAASLPEPISFFDFSTDDEPKSNYPKVVSIDELRIGIFESILNSEIVSEWLRDNPEQVSEKPFSEITFVEDAL
jgi:hypothetical protein